MQKLSRGTTSLMMYLIRQVPWSLAHKASAYERTSRIIKVGTDCPTDVVETGSWSSETPASSVGGHEAFSNRRITIRQAV